MKILVCVLNLARRRDRREWMKATLQLDEDEGITVKYINACDGLAGAGLAPMERKQEGAVRSVVGLMPSTAADQQPPDGAVRSDGFIRDEAGGLSHHGYTFRPRPDWALDETELHNLSCRWEALGYTPVDPDELRDFYGRAVNSGEMGCFASHHAAWVLARDTLRDDDIVVILEDDVTPFPFFVHSQNAYHTQWRRLVLSLREQLRDLNRRRFAWDLFYLGRNQQGKDQLKVNDVLVRPELKERSAVPGFSTCAHAYCLSTRGIIGPPLLSSYATCMLRPRLVLPGIQKLLEMDPHSHVIPVDDYLPALFATHPRRDLMAWLQHVRQSATKDSETVRKEMREAKDNRESLSTPHLSSEQSISDSRFKEKENGAERDPADAHEGSENRDGIRSVKRQKVSGSGETFQGHAEMMHGLEHTSTAFADQRVEDRGPDHEIMREENDRTTRVCASDTAENGSKGTFPAQERSTRCVYHADSALSPSDAMAGWCLSAVAFAEDRVWQLESVSTGGCADSVRLEEKDRTETDGEALAGCASVEGDCAPVLLRGQAAASANGRADDDDDDRSGGGSTHAGGGSDAMFGGVRSASTAGRTRSRDRIASDRGADRADADRNHTDRSNAEAELDAGAGKLTPAASLLMVSDITGSAPLGSGPRESTSAAPSAQGPGAWRGLWLSEAVWVCVFAWAGALSMPGDAAVMADVREASAQASHLSQVSAQVSATSDASANASAMPKPPALSAMTAADANGGKLRRGEAGSDLEARRTKSSADRDAKKGGLKSADLQSETRVQHLECAVLKVLRQLRAVSRPFRDMIGDAALWRERCLDSLTKDYSRANGLLSVNDMVAVEPRVAFVRSWQLTFCMHIHMSQREISPSSSSPVSDTGVARPDPASEHTSKTWTWAGRSGDLGGKHSTWTDFEHATRVFHGVETVCGERCKVGQLEERRGAELRFGEFKRKYDKGQAPVMIRGPGSTSTFELDKPRRELSEVREAPRSMGESEVELGETRRGDTRRMRESEQRQRRASGETSAPSAEEEEGDDVLEGTALLRALRGCGSHVMGRIPPMVLRACYAMSGTDMSHPNTGAIVQGAEEPPYMVRMTLNNYMHYMAACRNAPSSPSAPNPQPSNVKWLWLGEYDPLYLFDFRLPHSILETIHGPYGFFDDDLLGALAERRTAQRQRQVALQNSEMCQREHTSSSARGGNCKTKADDDALKKPDDDDEDWTDATILDERQWLLMGPAGSGSRWHVDPFGTSAWNLLCDGLKLWCVWLPPPSRFNIDDPTSARRDDDGDSASHPPPGSTERGNQAASPRARSTSPDGQPVPAMRWFQERLFPLLRQDPEPGARTSSVSSSAVQSPARLDGAQQAVGQLLWALQRPSDVMFVPHGCWHTVVNLEDGFGVTQNFVNKVNLRAALEQLSTSAPKLATEMRVIAFQDQE